MLTGSNENKSNGEKKSIKVHWDTFSINTGIGEDVPFIIVCANLGLYQWVEFLVNENSSSESIKILVGNDASVNDQDKNKNTPIQYLLAQKEPNEDLIFLLIEQGANLFLKNNIGFFGLKGLLSLAKNNNNNSTPFLFI